MDQDNERYNERLTLRVPIQYEKLFPDGIVDIPVTTSLRDLSQKNIGFYSQEKMVIDSKVKIVLFVSDKKFISFIGRVAKILFSDKADKKYFIGAEIELISKEDKNEIERFLKRVDIHSVVDNIDLSNVVDIHLVVGYPPVIKKIGRLGIENKELFDGYTLECLLLSMLDESRYEEFMAVKELNFVFTSHKGSRFRVNFHIQQGKIEATFRVIPAHIKSPSQLGLPKVTQDLLENKKGLILIAGRTGSGKTTTLASMVEYINSRRNGIIICIEDPIEYVHLNRKCIIKQRAIGKDTLSFFNATKNALRQNPDVLVIGEMLDTESMMTAIAAAETGALVLTTIHAGDVSQALDRVTSFFPADLQKHILKRLSLILRGVIAQEIIPRIDETGLVLAAEILVVTSAVRRTIRDGDWPQIVSLIQMGKNIGMQSMEDSLMQHYRNGLIEGEYIKEYVT